MAPEDSGIVFRKPSRSWLRQKGALRLSQPYDYLIKCKWQKQVPAPRSLPAATIWVSNKGLWSLFFSVTLLPLSYCLQRRLTNSRVMNDCSPVTTVSGLKRQTSQWSQGICSARVGFAGLLTPGSKGSGLSWRPEAASKNSDNKKGSGLLIQMP